MVPASIAHRSGLQADQPAEVVERGVSENDEGGFSPSDEVGMSPGFDYGVSRDPWLAAGGGCWWGEADYLVLWTSGNPVPALITTNRTVPPRDQAGLFLSNLTLRVSTVREITDAFSAPSPCPLPQGARDIGQLFLERCLTEPSLHPLLVQLLLWLLVLAIADPHFLGQREWITWPGYGKFWTQVVRQTMRSSDARGMHAEIVRRGLSADVTADLTDAAGRFVNQAAVQLTVIGPQLHPEKTLLQQTAPGRYTASFDTSSPGAYHLELSADQHGQTLYRQSRGLMVGCSDELRTRPVNESLLQQIAAVSGGRYSLEPTEVFNQPGRRATRPLPLWP